jgi:MSHA pilin protein MshC
MTTSATASARRFHLRAVGFTLVELVVAIGIIGLVAAIIGPRFVGRDTFAARGFFDQATQTVRYAQKISVASRKVVFVCVTSTSISASLTAGCAPPLVNPATGAALTVNAPSGVTIVGADFSFTAPTATQAGGQPSTFALVDIRLDSTVPGDPERHIYVERETGYVHN